jgi:hypothetical protein
MPLASDEMTASACTPALRPFLWHQQLATPTAKLWLKMAVNNHHKQAATPWQRLHLPSWLVKAKLALI